MPNLKDQIIKIQKGYFSFADLRKISEMDDNSLRVTISRMVKAGRVQKIGKAYYCTDISRVEWESFAMEVYGPCYLSFEWALAHYNILSQKAYNLTLATSKRAKQITVPGRVIVFRHIQEKLFWGYVREDKYFVAEPEKAFIDLAYFSLNGSAGFDPEEMDLKLLDRDRTRKYLKKVNIKKLTSLISSAAQL